MRTTRMLFTRKPMALALTIIIVTAIGGPSPASAQGRCIRAYGTPACNTDPIAPVFERTGWRTIGLDHIAFRVADPQKEAAFYAALMGWSIRSTESTRVVMDMGDWGTAIFRQAAPESFPEPAQTNRGGAATGPRRAGGDR